VREPSAGERIHNVNRREKEKWVHVLGRKRKVTSQGKRTKKRRCVSNIGGRGGFVRLKEEKLWNQKTEPCAQSRKKM